MPIERMAKAAGGRLSGAAATVRRIASRGLTGARDERNPKDFWTGVIYVVVGAGAMVIARDYELGTAFRMGPAYFPTVLGGLLVADRAPRRSVARSPVRRAPAAGAAQGFAGDRRRPRSGSALIVRGAGLGGRRCRCWSSMSAARQRAFPLGPDARAGGGLTLFCVLVFVKGLGLPLPLLGPWLGG